jgi:hypothetical protein
MKNICQESWNNDPSSPESQKETIYIDTLDKEKTATCCAKFVTDRILSLMQSLKTGFPESDNHSWNESNENISKLRSTDETTSNVLTVTFYKKTGSILAQ